MKGIIILFLVIISDGIKGEELFKDKEIFKPGRKWTYSAFFINTKKDTIDSQKIELEVFNEFCGLQRKIKWLYGKPQSYDSDTGLLRELNVPISYINEEATGVVENNEGVFLHPPRVGAFEFTELAPFPNFFRKKKQWENTLTISIWRHQEWLGLRVNTNAKIIKKVEIPTLYKKIPECLQIDARGESKLGIYKTTFYFHPQYGFVRWEYTKPDSTKVILDLEKVAGF